MERFRLSQPLDRRDRRAVQANSEERTALQRSSLDEDRACAALARVAANLRPGEAEPVAESVDEQRSRFSGERPRLPVHDEGHVKMVQGSILESMFEIGRASCRERVEISVG